MSRITVVGGGIIGLSCAWRLGQAGHQVVVVDGAPSVREASWAAAGMLAPHHEYDPALTIGADAEAARTLWTWGRASLDRWPAFVRDLDDEVDFRLSGGLVPLLAAGDRGRLDALAALGIPVEELTGAALRVAAPGLGSAVMACARLPAGQVDPRRVVRALARRLGDRVRRGLAAVDLEGTTVVTAEGRLDADLVVLASGAWTPDLARLAGIDLPGEPVQGQMVRFAGMDHLLTAFIHCHHAYVVPRAGAGLIVGSTMRWSGFDKREDPVEIRDLVQRARLVLPDLPEHPTESWSGLRPRLQNGLPLVARVRPGLIIATGHFRNGILLTPWTAERVVELVG